MLWHSFLRNHRTVSHHVLPKVQRPVRNEIYGPACSYKLVQNAGTFTALCRYILIFMCHNTFVQQSLGLGLQAYFLYYTK